MQNTLIFLMRIGLGWYMFWAGITKVLNPPWSAAGFLNGAQTFPTLFHFFASPAVLPVVNFLNEWGLTFIGVSLILGIGVRWSSIFGALLLMLYYFAHGFPRPDTYTYIVDYHVIFSLLLVYFALIRAGRVWGLDGWCSRLSLYSRSRFIRFLIG